jgi:hypothetical protein
MIFVKIHSIIVLKVLNFDIVFISFCLQPSELNGIFISVNFFLILSLKKWGSSYIRAYTVSIIRRVLILTN